MSKDLVSEDPSPDENFAFISTGSAFHIVSLPSRKIIVADVFDGGGSPSILWSADSVRFACSKDIARGSFFRAFARRNDKFVELRMPELNSPFYADIRSNNAKWIGQRDKPARWIDSDLVITSTGLLNFPDAQIDYSYESTVRFDERGIGKVVKVEKKYYKGKRGP